MSLKVTAVLTDAEVAALQAAIATMDTTMPFLQVVSLANKTNRQKMGNNATSYVGKGITTARNHRGILKQEFDETSYEKGNVLINQLLDVRTSLTTLAAKLDDTITLLGEDLMEQTNEVYNSIQRETRKNNSLKTVANELGEFYKRRNQPDKGTEPVAADKAATPPIA